MAKNTFEEDDELFGVDPNDKDDTLLGDEFSNSTIVSSDTDTKKITPASDEDKAKAKEKGKAESEEEKANRLAEEKKAADQALRDELAKEWEEEEDPDKKKPNTKTPDANTPGSEEVDGIQTVAEGLYKVGIFTKDSEDEEIPTTTEEFIEKFNSEKEKAAEALITDYASRYGDEYKDVFDAIFVDGASPREYLSKFEEVKDLKDLDLTDESNQEKIVTLGLTKLGFEPDAIKEKIKALKLSSELQTEAERYHKPLVKQEEKQLAAIQEQSKIRIEQKRLADEQYTNGITNILLDKLKKKEFDGIPVTKEVATKTKDFLDNKKWKLPSGELITDFDYFILELNKPQNHALKVKLGLMVAPIFKPGQPIDLNLGPIKKAAVSQENREIFNFNKDKKTKFNSKPKEEEEGISLKDF